MYDYSYDANGNMTKDNNKNITAITYNHLNLPTKITFATTGNIVYLYNATGQKVQKIVTVTSPASVTTTDYLGGYQYDNVALKFFPTAEGYVEPVSGSYKYVYQHKDHLGNVRLSYDKTLAIKEESNFYPFGLKQEGYNTVKTGVENKYKYNGKELQDELGLNTYDYGKRNYDAALGRFFNIDRFTEKYVDVSGYHYSANNPVTFRDIAGDSIRTYFYNKEGRRTNSIPSAVQKMFNEEFGIKVGYNSDTNMLYYEGDYESDLSQSESATNSLVDALKDDNTGKNADKHGTIMFGYNTRGVNGGDIDGGIWDRTGGVYSRGVTQIDLADFDANGLLKSVIYSTNLNPRAFNLARIFEHEYLGHQRLFIGGFGDGDEYNMGKVVESVNLYARERKLPELLNYGGSTVFFGDTSVYQSKGEQRRAVKKMINGTMANNLFAKSKK